MRNNLGLKVISLITALVLSYYVRSEIPMSVIGFPVPIEIKGVPPNKIVVEPIAPMAQVTIRGPSYAISKVPSFNPTIEVDVPPDAEDHVKIFLSEDKLKIPSGIEVLSIDPNVINIKIENLVEKEVEVIVPQFGAMDSKILLGSIEVRPKKVKAIGPESKIKNMTIVYTDPVDLSVIDKDTEVELKLASKIPFVRFKPDRVRLSVKVRSRQVERVFDSIPIEVRIKGRQFVSVQPEVVSIEVSGPMEAVNNLKESDIVPYVQVPQEFFSSDNDSMKVNVNLKLPEGVKLIYLEPKVVVIKKQVEN